MSKFLRNAATVCLAGAFAFAAFADLTTLIPSPKTVTPGSGSITLTSTNAICAADATLKPTADALADYILKTTGTALATKVATSGAAGDIILSLNTALAVEEYSLTAATTIDIKGKTVRGVAWGTATLLQLMNKTLSVPKVTISDAPETVYRGVELDVARKYNSIETVKQLVDAAYFYKLNYVLLHLTDDQRFCFPSTAYPNALSVNGYTKAQLQDLEAYSVARGVNIIPEFDVPGHSGVLLSKYGSVFGNWYNSIDIRNATARSAVQTIIGEMCDVFQSSPYFHLGADECAITTGQEFVTFITQMNNYVKSRNKQTIIWQGYTSSLRIPADIILLWWQSGYSASQMIADGHPVINASWFPLNVVDHYPWVQYTMYTNNDIFAWTKHAFAYDGETPATISPNAAVLGGQLTMWEGKDWNAIPFLRNRIPALSARTWALSKETDVNNFRARFAATESVVEKMMYPVTISATPLVNNYGKQSQQFAEGAITVTMSSSTPGTIRYITRTTAPSISEERDGETSAPNASSTPYTGPITVSRYTLVKAALFNGTTQIGGVNRIGFQPVTQDRSNVTYARPVTTNANPYIEHPASLLVDGVVDSLTFWSCYPNPKWATIDLEAAYSINKVTVYPRFGSDYGGYAVEKYRLDGSTDNATWTSIADYSGNTTVATAAGYQHSITARTIRYIRITPTGNTTAFPLHSKICEIRAYGTNTTRPVLYNFYGATQPNAKPKFRWRPVASATSYTITMANNQAFTGASTTPNVTDTSFTPAQDLANSKWYWKVSSNLNATNFSGVDSLVIGSTGVERFTSSIHQMSAIVSFRALPGGVFIALQGTSPAECKIQAFDVLGRTIALNVHAAPSALICEFGSGKGAARLHGAVVVRVIAHNRTFIHRMVVAK